MAEGTHSCCLPPTAMGNMLLNDAALWIDVAKHSQAIDRHGVLARASERLSHLFRTSAASFDQIRYKQVFCNSTMLHPLRKNRTKVTSSRLGFVFVTPLSY